MNRGIGSLPRVARALRHSVIAVVVAAGGGGCVLNPDFDDAASGSSGGFSEEGADIIVTQLAGQWSTPNAIRWGFDPQGEPDALAAYELVTGSTAQAVSERFAGARLWTANDNPELGRFLLPGNGGVVRATVSDDLEPDREYFAQITAVDTSGRRAASNVASFRTRPPAVAEIELFSETETQGYSIPVEFAYSDAFPAAGASHYRYAGHQCEDAEGCFENLRRQGLGPIDFAPVAGPGFGDAFFEFQIRVENGTPSFWSQVRLWFSPDDSLAMYGGFTIRADGGYSTVQVPLRELDMGLDETRPLQPDQMAAGLFEFGVGGSWREASIVDIDEVKVRW